MCILSEKYSWRKQCTVSSLKKFYQRVEVIKQRRQWKNPNKCVWIKKKQLDAILYYIIWNFLLYLQILSISLVWKTMPYCTTIWVVCMRSIYLREYSIDAKDIISIQPIMSIHDLKKFFNLFEVFSKEKCCEEEEILQSTVSIFQLNA